MLGYYLNADDTQFYFAFKPIPGEQQASIACTEACLSEIGSWMVQNKLKLNQNKTEFLVLNAQHRPQPMIDFIKVNTDRVEPSFFLHEILVLSLIRPSPWRSTSHTYANHRFIIYVIQWNPSKPDTLGTGGNVQFRGVSGVLKVLPIRQF